MGNTASVNRVYRNNVEHSCTAAKRNSKKKAARIRKRIGMFVVTAALFFALGLFAASLRTDASAEYASSKVYTSITVEPGESLWTIAAEYAGFEYSDTRDYVSEVMKLNNLSSDEIHSGEHLIIPYTKTAE